MTAAQLVEQIEPMLPPPVRRLARGRAVVLTGGDPGDVVVTVTASTVTVAVYRVRWDGPHTPTPDHQRVGSVACRELQADAWRPLVRGLVDAALTVRRNSYRTCERCGRPTPPEWLYDETTCQGCAERHLGVVH